jgi:hypothetical protein
LLAAVLLVPTSKAGKGLFDGHWWRDTSLEKVDDPKLVYFAHAAYLQGAIEGGILFGGWKKLPAQFSYQDLSDALDEFYSHPENRSMPIVLAIEIVGDKFFGARPEPAQQQ